MASGVRPFCGRDSYQILAAVANGSQTPLAELSPELAEEFCLLLESLLAKDPARRPAGAALVVERLRKLELQIQTLPAGGRHAGPAEQTRKKSRRFKRVSIAAAFVAALAIFAAIAAPRRERPAVDLSAERAVLAQSRQELQHKQYVADIQGAHEAWQKGDLARANELLAKYAAPEQHELRGFEWDHLWGALRARPQPRRVIDAGHGEVYHIEYSPDGSLLAAACQDGNLQLWNTADWQPSVTIAAHKGDANWVTFAPDGQTLASAGDDGVVRTWNASSGGQLDMRLSPQKPVVCVAFSPDGRWLATGSELDGGLRIWDASTGNLLADLAPNGEGRVESLALSADGRRLIAACRTENGSLAELWDTTNWNLLLAQYLEGIFSIALTPDGKTMAVASGEGVVRLFSVPSGVLEAILGRHAGALQAVAYSRDGMLLAAGGNDGIVEMYDTATNALRARLYGHQDRVWSVAFSPDGKTLASSGRDGTIHLWDTQSLSGALIINEESTVHGVAITDDGRLITVSRAVRVRDAASLEQQFEINVPKDSVSTALCQRAVAFGGAEGEVSVLDLGSKSVHWLAGGGGRPEMTNPDHIGRMAFTPPGDKLAVCVGHEIQLWDVTNRRMLAKREFPGPSSPCNIAAAHGGKSFLFAYDGLGWWHPESEGSPMRHFPLDKHITVVAVSPDGRTVAAGAADGTITLFDAAGGKWLATLTGHHLQVALVAFSPDQRTLASGSADGTVRLWNLATHSELFVLERWASYGPKALAFFPDGKALVTAGASLGNQGRISLWFGRGP